MVDAKDFAQSAFKVMIAKCQQAALEQAQMSVPDPSRQLELLSAKRLKGRSRGAAKLSHYYCPTIPGLQAEPYVGQCCKSKELQDSLNFASEGLLI